MIGKLTGLLVGVGALCAPALAFAECKETFIGRSRSDAAVSDAERQRLALDDAIAHWRKQVRLAYGFDYRYWQAAQAKRVQCTGSPGLRKCTVRARPCKLPGA